MEIWHRISFSRHADVDGTLDALGIKYEVSPGHVITLEMAESDGRWPAVRCLRQDAGRATGVFGPDFVRTEFTTDEILAAEWLMVVAVRWVGYAEPQRGGAWHRMTIEGGCPECSVGQRQVAPYRIRQEPRLGKRAFGMLYNNLPLFCTAQVLDALEEAQIQGYETWPVLLNRTGEPSQVFRQVIVPTVAQPALAEELAETEEFRKEVCAVCGQVRYTPYVRGMMPMRRASLAEDVDIQLTYEWFGSLHAARREILVSNRVARVVVERGWKDIVLWPLQFV